jgi:hypothetical protein
MNMARLALNAKKIGGATKDWGRNASGLFDDLPPARP